MIQFTPVLRGLRRTPGQSFVAALVLTIATAGATTVFTVVQGLLMPPVSYGEPDRVAVVRPGNPPWELFERWRDEARLLDGVAAYTERAANLVEGGGAERLLVGHVTQDFFRTARVSPVLGRDFDQQDFRTRDGGTTLITHRLWRERYNASPSVIGRSIALDGQAFTIVGVLPKDFRSPTELRSGRNLSIEWGAQVVVPQTGDPRIPDPTRSDRRSRGLYVLVRLRSGVDIGSAQRELAAIAARLGTTFVRPGEWTLIPLPEDVTADLRTQMAILAAAVGLLLVVACVNAASLILGRSLARRREMATRAALGASRGALLRHTMVEATLLGLAGVGPGLLLGFLGTRAVAIAAGSSVAGLDELSMSPTVSVVGVSLAFGVSLAAGAIAGFRVSAANPVHAIQEAPTDAGNSLPATLLVATQVGTAVVVLVTAALLGTDLLRAAAVDLGFQPRGVVTADVSVSPARGLNQEALLGFFRVLQAKAAAIPGVTFVAVAGNPPGSLSTTVVNVEVRDREGGWIESSELAEVVDGPYFKALSVPVRQGRALEESDGVQSEPAIVVSAGCAQKHWGGVAESLNREIRFGRSVYRVVGIVNDVKIVASGRRDPCMLYFAYAQFPRPLNQMTLFIRSETGTSGIGPQVRAVVKELDPLQPVYNVMTLERIVFAPLARPRLVAAMVGVFSAFALAIAIVGVYGAMWCAVNGRRHEIGVRLALGGSPSQVRVLLIRQGLRGVALGIAVGLPVAQGLTYALASQLVAVRRGDWSTAVVVSMVVFDLAFLGCARPAVMASSASPIAALKRE